MEHNISEGTNTILYTLMGRLYPEDKLSLFFFHKLPIPTFQIINAELLEHQYTTFKLETDIILKRYHIQRTFYTAKMSDTK